MKKTEIEVQQRVESCRYDHKPELTIQSEIPIVGGCRIYYVICREKYPGIFGECGCAAKSSYTPTKRASVERRLEIVATAWDDRVAKEPSPK